MKLMMPTVGSKLKLLEPWTFCLFHERRNDSLGIRLGLNPNTFGYGKFVFDDKHVQRSVYAVSNVTLPAGTTLKVERIYIKRGSSDYDSLTFTVQSCPIQLNEVECTSLFKISNPDSGRTNRNSKPRFWVKLYDANSIQFEEIDDSFPK